MKIKAEILFVILDHVQAKSYTQAQLSDSGRIPAVGVYQHGAAGDLRLWISESASAQLGHDDQYADCR